MENPFAAIRKRRILRVWEKRGRPLPPPDALKQETVKDYGRRFHLDVFIETGAYLGDMVYAVRTTFPRIWSIELDSALAEGARQRFRSHGHITIVQGDSATSLPEILAGLREPCLFWLDGHYSGGVTAKGSSETPVREELRHILDHPVKNHVILIDDARCFTGEKEYPTIDEIREIIRSRRPSWTFDVKDDIIRIHGKEQPT
ncbi:MAG: hypothetical protein JW884_14745 [Deltaproteobacteria bacterium]|nr:hypothetical protein [Deltaproteobacteria bacterium]